MSKLNLKRAPRTKPIKTSAGDITLRPLNALDISELVNKFDLETIELTARLISIYNSGGDIGTALLDPQNFISITSALPELIASALTMCAGGDDDDYEAIRELPAEEFAVLTAELISHSLQRIGGLGNLLALATEAASKAQQALDLEIQKRNENDLSDQFGVKSPS